MEDYAEINTAALHQVAAWTMDDTDIARIFADCEDADLQKYKTQMNREVVRIAMMVLCHRALNTNDSERQSFSLRQLAVFLDAPKAESMQRTLRNWLLPMLTEAGWIDGFVRTTDWSTSPHEIEISDRGLSATIAYLSKLRDLRTA
jgi:hypothetical protein